MRRRTHPNEVFLVVGTLIPPESFVLRLYTAASTQEDVFTNEVEPLATRALQGLNATAFTYGVTGSGKTHSMMGREQV